MNVGYDGGYYSAKIKTELAQKMTVCALGSYDVRDAGITGVGAAGMGIHFGEYHYLVGETALAHSRDISRPAGRDYPFTPLWRAMFYASLAQVLPAGAQSIALVTGLPLAYASDRANLQELILGKHSFRTEASKHLVEVAECTITDQSFGAAFAEVLSRSEHAEVMNNGRVGVIDWGGGTCNFNGLEGLNTVVEMAHSDTVGVWKSVRDLGRVLGNRFPQRRWVDHEITMAMAARAVTYNGETFDIAAEVAQALAPRVKEIASIVNTIWAEALGGLDAIMLTGGTSILAGDELTKVIPRSFLASDPVMANVQGYYEFAKMMYA